MVRQIYEKAQLSNETREDAAQIIDSDGTYAVPSDRGRESKEQRSYIKYKAVHTPVHSQSCCFFVPQNINHKQNFIIQLGKFMIFHLQCWNVSREPAFVCSMVIIPER